MSYLDLLPPEQHGQFTVINDSIRDLFQQAKTSILNQPGNINFSDVELKFENKIFSRNCDFTGNFECSIEYKNCYFLNDARFYNAKLDKQLSFNHCFFDGEIYIGDNVEIDHFDLIMASVKRQMYVRGGTIYNAQWTLIDNSILKINGGTYGILNIGYWGGGSKLKELSFHFTKVKGSIKITGDKAKIERLDLFQFAEDVSLSIEDISVIQSAYTGIETKKP